MVADYHAYERELCRAYLAPLLQQNRFVPSGKSVLDVGCGYGGVLAELAERFPLQRGLGIDLDGEMVDAGRGRCPSDVKLETEDFFGLSGGRFDLILMRDVLEHIGDVEGALAKAAGMLRPGGVVYVSFAPFYSPFGGHQHLGDGFFSYVPWLQLLPERRFRRLLRLSGNTYKTGRGLARDMESVLGTRLTLARFRRSLDRAGLEIRYYAQYLVRPDYRIKFGILPLPLPAVPGLEELLCTGADAILSRR
jgi:SAM-dependent methyltransferase